MLVSDISHKYLHKGIVKVVSTFRKIQNCVALKNSYNLELKVFLAGAAVINVFTSSLLALICVCVCVCVCGGGGGG